MKVTEVLALLYGRLNATCREHRLAGVGIEQSLHSIAKAAPVAWVIAQVIPNLHGIWKGRLLSG